MVKYSYPWSPKLSSVVTSSLGLQGILQCTHHVCLPIMQAVLESNWPTSRNWNRIRTLIYAISHFRSPLKRQLSASPFTTLEHHPNFVDAKDVSNSSMLALSGSPTGSTTASEGDVLPQRSSSAIIRETDYTAGTEHGMVGGKLVFSNPDLSLEDDLETNIVSVYSPRRISSIGRSPTKRRSSSSAPADFCIEGVGRNVNVADVSPHDGEVGETEADCSVESPPLPLSSPPRHESSLADSPPLLNSHLPPDPDVPPPLPESSPPNVVPQLTHTLLPDTDDESDANNSDSQDNNPALDVSHSGLNPLLTIFEMRKNSVSGKDTEISSTHSTPVHGLQRYVCTVTDETDFGRQRKRGHRRDWSDVSLSSSVANTFGGLSADVKGDVAIEVNMASCNRCRRCQALLFDEQIMSRWNPDDSDFTTRYSLLLFY